MLPSEVVIMSALRRRKWWGVDSRVALVAREVRVDEAKCRGKALPIRFDGFTYLELDAGRATYDVEHWPSILALSPLCDLASHANSNQVRLIDWSEFPKFGLRLSKFSSSRRLP